MELDEYIDKNIQLGANTIGLAADVADYLRTYNTDDYISLEKRYEFGRKFVQENRGHETIQDVSRVLHEHFTDKEIEAQKARFREKMTKIELPTRLVEMVISEWLPGAKTLDAETLDSIAQSINGEQGNTEEAP